MGRSGRPAGRVESGQDFGKFRRVGTDRKFWKFILSAGKFIHF